MRPRSLAGQLMLAAFVGILAATIVAIVLFLSFRPSLESMQRAELNEAIDDVSRALQVDAGGGVRLAFKPLELSMYDAMPNDAVYLVTDAAGTVVARSDDSPALRALAQLPVDAQRFEVVNGDRTIALWAMRGTIERGGTSYTIVAARSERLVTGLNEYASKLYARGGARTALMALVVFALVVFLIVRRSLRPLREASELAAGIGPRNLSARLRVDGLPTELVPLIEAFNNALGRLEQGYRVQQEFLATAAHELKTPLALLRGEIELGGAANREVLLHDTALMARQVNQLLHLAEASEGHNYQFAGVSLQAAAFDAVGYVERLAARRQVRLRVDATGGASTVEADSGAVFMLLKNLLENAVHHSPPGSTVSLSVSPQGFVVADSGPGIAAEQLARLFERFNRGSGGTHGGAGLGLAICREICLAHGWDIHLDETHPAPGTRFIVVTGAVDEGGHGA